MPSTPSAQAVLDREFLAVRAKMLEIAAALDRMDRGEGAPLSDPRLDQIRRGLAILTGQAGSRAEQIQMLFSLPYDHQWKTKIGVAP